MFVSNNVTARRELSPMPATLPWRKKGTKYVISEHVPWTLNNLFMCHDFPYPCQLLPVEPRRILIFDLTIRFTWRLCLPRSRIRCWTGLTWNVKLSFVAPINLKKKVTISWQPGNLQAVTHWVSLISCWRGTNSSQWRLSFVAITPWPRYLGKKILNMQMLGKYEAKIGRIFGKY